MNSKITFAAVKAEPSNTKAADRHHGSMTWADLAAALLPDRTDKEN